MARSINKLNFFFFTFFLYWCSVKIIVLYSLNQDFKWNIFRLLSFKVESESVQTSPLPQVLTTGRHRWNRYIPFSLSQLNYVSWVLCSKLIKPSIIFHISPPIAGILFFLQRNCRTLFNFTSNWTLTYKELVPECTIQKMSFHKFSTLKNLIGIRGVKSVEESFNEQPVHSYRFFVYYCFFLLVHPVI